MRTGFLTSIALLLVSTGLAVGQTDPPEPNGGDTVFGAEYLLWFFKQPVTAPLVSTGSVASRGTLGQPGSSDLFGSPGGGDRADSGVRFYAATWLTDMLGIEGSGFVLAQRSNSFQVNSNAAGSPVLARPIINSLTGTEAVSQISLPGAFAGGLTAVLNTQLWGLETNLIYNPYHSTDNWPEWLIGMRYLNLNDHLDIVSSSRLLPGGVTNFNGAPVFAPNTLVTADHFDARSQFYGGQIGFRSRFEFLDCMYLETIGKVALGNTHEEINIIGSTTLVPPSGPSHTVVGGLLALESDIGHFSRDDLTVVPEGTLNLGCWITPNLRSWVGFNFLYWSDVFRAGEQINRAVNPTLDPRSAVFGASGGVGQPTVLRHTNNDFWLYGLNAGIAIEF